MPEKDAFAQHQAAHLEPWHSLEGRLIREVIFGINDGLITAFGFVSGVSGVHITPLLIFLTGIAQAFAGGGSMMFGAYLSTKAQRQFFDHEIEKEKREIERDPERETEEIHEIYRARGFTPEETEILAKRITSNKEQWLSFMIREELGLIPERFDSPWKVAIIIGISFLIGGLVPVLPYLFLRFNGSNAMIVSAILTLISLFAVGAGKSKFTKTSWFSGGLEMLCIGILVGGTAYGIGHLASLMGFSPI